MSAPTTPLTRRQRRDAERAAEAAAARVALAERAEGQVGRTTVSAWGAAETAEIPAAVGTGLAAPLAPAAPAHVPDAAGAVGSPDGSLVPPVPVATAVVAAEACRAARAMDPEVCGEHRITWDEIVSPGSAADAHDQGEDAAVMGAAAAPRRSRSASTRRAEAGSRRPRAAGARSHRAAQRRPAGMATRAGVMGVLGVVTIVAPLASSASGASGTTGATAALGLGTEPTAQAATAEPTTASTQSVAAEVLGSDADVDETSSDATLRSVPDAATRARIREAYENAAVTCSPTTTAASGDSAAFSTAPTLFYPMVEGTYTVSSEYGWRLHPTLGYLKLHAGQDFAAAEGTPIYAVADGTVTTAGVEDGVGTITIRHEIDGQVWYTSYLHMYADGIYVSAGDQVKAGQLIAGVGNTGNSTGAHLHFEVRTADDTSDETTVDPAAWLVDHHAAQLSTDCS